MQMTLPQRPTRATLAAYLDPLKATVKGKMVLVGVPQQVQVSFNPPALRRDDADVMNTLNAAPAGGPAPHSSRRDSRRSRQRASSRPRSRGTTSR